MSDAPRPARRSWWLEEALALPEFAGPEVLPLRGETRADVVILGGGYTGMWTAWFLKERSPDLDVVLLEADICGGGPSGRNGGFCDGWWGHLGDLVRTYGESDALELLMTVGRSPAEIGAWCERHGVDAWFTHAGDLAVETNPTHRGIADATLELAARLGIADEYEALTPLQVQERCASPAFGAGMLIHDAANVQPARLARGLRRVLIEAGVRVFEGSPVTRFRSSKPVVAETPLGSVRAAEAVIGLGAWATWWREFYARTTVRGSYMVVTEPAPERLAALGWTGGEQIRDRRSSIHYARATRDGRIALGLGGLQPDLARHIDHRYDFEERFVRRVAQDLVRLFPPFEGVPIEAGWGGPINVSGFTMPFFGSTGRHGNIHYGLGYTGNGVGPSHLGGKILASLVLHAGDGFTRLAVVTKRPKRFPPEPIRSPGMLIANAAIRRKDDLEDAGRRVDPLTMFAAQLPRRLGFNLGPHRR
ncbi:MAG TPA: FAD-dependent oxidoreductase [Actinomycetota bacterium]|nr:FAD-dependent oxidoreductase [Actinomycetota bacterium]